MTQIAIPAIGRSRFHRRINSGEKTLNGGRVSARQMLAPFHQPAPRHFERPAKK
jgi:hypothetical protein